MQFFRPINKIKAMTFDLDDTLYDNSPIIKQAEAALLARLRETFPKTADLPKNAWQHIKTTLIQQDARLASDMTMLRTQSLYHALAIEKLTEQERNRAAQQLCNHFYRARSNFHVAANYTQVLTKLATKIPLIAITNGNVDTTAIGISPFFKQCLHASIQRPKKPSRHMFIEAMQYLNLAPHHILHIGDSLVNDVLGAHRVGMHTAWFACNRAMVLKKERAPVLPSVQLDNFNQLLHFTDDS